MVSSLNLLAPAKINIYLHVTGRRDDGYHNLDSLVVFADIGDRLQITPTSGALELTIRGPFAGAFTAEARDAGSQSTNLVIRAARALAGHVGRDPAMHLTLTKSLPLAAGIGGGSADAAALIWGLMEMWGIPVSAPFLPDLMRGIGMDVPACLRCAPVRMTGRGDILEHIANLPEMPVVLVNPGKVCPTPEVFRRFKGPMRGDVCYPSDLATPAALIAFLEAQDNDLVAPAREIVPDIDIALGLLAGRRGCRLARMSGSGATVFGLFDTREAAESAAEEISFAQPQWWVRHGTINSPARY